MFYTFKNCENMKMLSTAIPLRPPQLDGLPALQASKNCCHFLSRNWVNTTIFMHSQYLRTETQWVTFIFERNIPTTIGRSLVLAYFATKLGCTTITFDVIHTGQRSVEDTVRDIQRLWKRQLWFETNKQGLGGLLCFYVAFCASVQPKLSLCSHPFLSNSLC